MHWWINVPEGPFISRQLAVWVHVPPAGKKQKLALCEFSSHQGERNAMESQVPSGKPRVFPVVRHGKNVRIIEMGPFSVPTPFTLRGRRKLTRVSVEPLRNVVVEELFAPDHARERLALHVASIRI